MTSHHYISHFTLTPYAAAYELVSFFISTVCAPTLSIHVLGLVIYDLTNELVRNYRVKKN